MRVKVFFVLLSCAGLLMTSCIKDEPKNNECDIISAWVEGEESEKNFYQLSQMRQDVLSTDKEIVFNVRSLISLSQMAVHFELTPGATIEPANGSLQNFSDAPVIYTVTSEDGAWQKKYVVSFREATMPSYKFSFEHVDVDKVTADNTSTYNIFYEIDKNGNRHNIWASGNPGVALVQYKWTPDMFPTHSIDDGYEGKGVCLRTQYAGDLGRDMGKPIAAGNLFFGSFDLISVLFNPLKSTVFGIDIDREPVRVTGYYKYKPGEKFTDMKMKEIAGRIDEASIYAVFYRNEADGKKVWLYGDDVLTSPHIVKKAEVAALPPTDKWTRFEMFFEGGDADVELLANHGYNLALVFSSSKDGAKFEGAIGSVLYVDEVEVSFEDEE